MSPGGTNLKPTGDFLRPELEGDKAVQARILGLIDNATRRPALGNAVMRHGSPDYWRASYVSKTGKSMKTVKLAASEKDCWRNISISLINRQSKQFSLSSVVRSSHVEPPTISPASAGNLALRSAQSVARRLRRLIGRDRLGWIYLHPVRPAASPSTCVQIERPCGAR